MITSADHYNKAIQLWFELTGLDPNAKSFTIGSWGIMSMSKEIKESIDYDPSFITAYLLLDAFSTGYFKDAKVSVAEFDEDPDKVFDYMDKVREFKKLIRDPAITRPADEFFGQVRLALLSYGIEADRIENLFKDRANLALLRRDALRSVNRMRVDQFLSGATDPQEIKPVYNRVVFGYWNINSMIEHVCSMPSGISLNLIRDPDELHSYFAFAVRNGGNLIFLTDVPEYAHPLGRSMSRRPDRAFEERAGKNWFPYQLLAIKHDEKGNPYHDKYRAAVGKNLVAHQPKHFELKKLVELELGQIVWTTLMFDLILERYWRNPIEPRALSYTNEMIRLEDEVSLLAHAAGANLPVVGYQPLELPMLTVADVMSDALDEAAIGKRMTGHDERYGENRWMEERYGAAVPIEALNQIGSKDEGVLFLAADTNAMKAAKPSRGGGGAIVTVEGVVHKATTTNHIFHGETPLSHYSGVGRAYTLEMVDATLFGTREEIDADRKFIARYNFCKALQMEADTEFAAERPGILRWFEKCVTTRIDTLMAYAQYEKVEHARRRWGSFTRTYGEDAPDADKMERYNFSYVSDLTRKLERWEYSNERGNALLSFDEGTNRSPFYHHCYLTGARSSWQLLISPGCPADLAFMMGVGVSDLPVYLQNWNPGDNAYVGNSILDRSDPLEWKLDNPWNQINFQVSIFLSKRGRNQIIKEGDPLHIPDVSGIHYSGPVFQNRGGRSLIPHSNWDIKKYTKETQK